ncbi:S24/S26 family peptidase [Ornithinimicrobium avium]|uniref:S24/S26 family peptidase n=1 Tax=Ornithinimicrobium avium TaxID=2283195 RepID=UPI0013B4552C|nr:S24/S26 family peptidase [Ornithinimicrobium avium]
MAAVTAGPRPPRVVRSSSKGHRKSVLGWALLITVVLAWAFTFRPTQLGGPATFIVVSGDSMEPTLSDGDLVVLRAHDAYAVGDIATFTVPDGEPGAGALVIHRLVGVEGDAFVPQGDNRDQTDDWRPMGADVKGTLWLHVPRGGDYLMRLIHPPLMAALAGGLATTWFLLRSPRSTRAEGGDEN